MKKRFTEEQIIGFIKEAEAGLPVDALCRKHGFGNSTFYKWKAKFGGMDTSMIARCAIEHFRVSIRVACGDCQAS